MAPNALAVAQECSWFLVPVHVFGAMRWTCWNTVRAGGGGGIFGGDGGGEVENRTTDDGGCPGSHAVPTTSRSLLASYPSNASA